MTVAIVVAASLLGVAVGIVIGVTVRRRRHLLESADSPTRGTTHTSCGASPELSDELLELAPWEGALPGASSRLTVTPRIRAGLAPVLRAARSIHRTANTYTIRLPPNLAHQVARGDLSLMKAADGGIRSAIIDGEGKIVGHAAFRGAGTAAVAATAAWQLAAMITAQHFLVGVDEKLRAIERGVGELKTALDHKDRGALAGNLAKLRSIAQAASAADLTEHDVNAHVVVIEEIDRECRQLGQAAVLDGEAVLKELREMTPKVTWAGATLDTKVSSFRKLLEQYERTAMREVVSIHVRAATAQVRASLPTSRAWTALRLDEIRAELADARARQAEFLDLAATRTSELQGLLTSDRRDIQHRDDLRARTKAMSSGLETARERIERGTSQLSDKFADTGRHRSVPSRLLVETDDEGEPVRISAIAGDGEDIPARSPRTGTRPR